MNMHTRSASTMSGAPRRFGRKILLAALGGGIVLVAVVGAGLRAHSDTSEPASPPAEAVAVQPAVKTAVAPANASYTPPPHVVYLVRSNEQAEGVSAAASVAFPSLMPADRPPLLYRVVVATSEDEAALVFEAVEQTNRILSGLGFIKDTVVDLR